MISPSSLLGGVPSPSLGSLTTPGLSGAGNAGTTGGLSGTQSLFSTPSANAGSSTLGGGIPGLGDSGVSGAIQQILSMLTMILSMLLPMLQQGAAGGTTSGTPSFDRSSDSSSGSSGGGGGPTATVPPQLSNSTNPPTAGPAPTNSGELIAGIRNKTTDPSQKQRLDTTLAKVAKDPDGAKLLQAAEANGYSIEVGDPSGSGSQDHDADSVNGVTIPEQKRIIISPNAPDFDKTVVHELVHAATQSDGNSQTEEGMADVIGYRVSSRIDGQQEPGSEQQIFQNKIKSYPNLNANNDIMNSLNKLGISA